MASRVVSRFTKRALSSNNNLLQPATLSRPFTCSAQKCTINHKLDDPPVGIRPQTPARGPRCAPTEEKNPKDKELPSVYLGTKRRLPEFILTDKVVLVTGAARGLGLTQAEALLEGGATGKNKHEFLFVCLQTLTSILVYALDRLEEPVSPTNPSANLALEPLIRLPVTNIPDFFGGKTVRGFLQASEASGRGAQHNIVLSSH